MPFLVLRRYIYIDMPKEKNLQTKPYNLPLSDLAINQNHEIAGLSSGQEHDAYALLEESVSLLERHQELSEIITPLIVADAHDLASRMLPREETERLHLRFRNADNISEEGRANLRGLYLLARSYDITGDPAIAGALDYVFDEMPPYAADILAEAWHQTRFNENSVMQVNNLLESIADDRWDSRQLPEDRAA